MEKIKITEKMIRRALDFTSKIVVNYPGRLAGTESCTKAGLNIMEEVKKNCDTGTVKREPFTCHPKAFLKFIPWTVLFYAITLDILG